MAGNDLKAQLDDEGHTHQAGHPPWRRAMSGKISLRARTRARAITPRSSTATAGRRYDDLVAKTPQRDDDWPPFPERWLTIFPGGEVPYEFGGPMRGSKPGPPPDWSDWVNALDDLDRELLRKGWL